MKKVLHVINGDHFAGAERVQDLLAICLPQYGWTVEFAELKSGDFAKKRSSTVALHSFPMKSRFDMGTILQLLKLARQNQYSILHSHTPRSLLVSSFISLLTGIPLVYHFHSPASLCSSSVTRNRVNAVLEKIILPLFVDRVIGVSNAMIPHIKKTCISEKKISVALNGVQMQDHKVEFSTEKDGFDFICVALFRERKGIDVLIKAFSLAKKMGKFPARLFLVGRFESDNYKQHIMQLVSDFSLENDVIFEGFCNEVTRRMLNAHCLVLPSLQGEGLPMVVLEAMAVGLPVIASNVEGTGEAVINEKTGFLVGPGDSEGLARAMIKICNLSRESLSQLSDAAIALQRGQFSDDSMAKSIVGVYEKI